MNHTVYFSGKESEKRNVQKIEKKGIWVTLKSEEEEEDERGKPVENTPAYFLNNTMFLNLIF